MSDSWKGIKVRKGNREGVVIDDMNNYLRILTVKMDDDGSTDKIIMNNVRADPPETKEWEWLYNHNHEDVWYRFYRLKEVGLRQFPMIYETKEKHANLELKQFQSWVIRRLYFKEDFNHYRNRREKRYELNASVS